MTKTYQMFSPHADQCSLLNNLENLMKAAEAESLLMSFSPTKDDVDEQVAELQPENRINNNDVNISVNNQEFTSNTQDTPDILGTLVPTYKSICNDETTELSSDVPNNNSTELSDDIHKPRELLTHIPNKKPKNNLMSDIKSSLNATTIADALNKLSNDPNEMSRMLEHSAGQVTPEMMEEARKIATGSQGQNILKIMQRRGVDPNSMKAQALQQQRTLKGLVSKTGITKKCILITGNRQLKIRNIPIGSEQISAINIVKSNNPVELSCSRLATGSLEGKTIKLWYDPELKGKNRRLTRIAGFPIAGSGLIIMKDGDLDEKDFISAEKLLQ